MIRCPIRTKQLSLTGSDIIALESNMKARNIEPPYHLWLTTSQFESIVDELELQKRDKGLKKKFRGRYSNTYICIVE